jgi:hypothetical protein
VGRCLKAMVMLVELIEPFPHPLQRVRPRVKPEHAGCARMVQGAGTLPNKRYFGIRNEPAHQDDRRDADLLAAPRSRANRAGIGIEPLPLQDNRNGMH